MATGIEINFRQYVDILTDIWFIVIRECFDSFKALKNKLGN